jgi:transcriptional regulator of arginine metabolism
MTVDQLILRLIEKHELADQAELLKHLAKQGHALTQSTLSRHLKKLGVVKREGRYQKVEVAERDLPEAQILDAPPNLLVLRTTQGFAPALAYILDEKLPRDLVAGTVAGEDTVFVALADPAKRAETKAALRRILGLKGE